MWIKRHCIDAGNQGTPAKGRWTIVLRKKREQAKNPLLTVTSFCWGSRREREQKKEGNRWFAVDFSYFFLKLGLVQCGTTRTGRQLRACGGGKQGKGCLPTRAMLVSEWWWWIRVVRQRVSPIFCTFPGPSSLWERLLTYGVFGVDSTLMHERTHKAQGVSS